MSLSSKPSVEWARLVRVHDSSAGLHPARLAPGHDLVLHAPGHHGATLPAGTLLDDWLTREDRAAVDLEANRHLVRWRKDNDAALTIRGVCLPHVHEGELLADVFLRERRVFDGVRAAFRRGRPQRVALHGVDGELADALEVLLGQLGVALAGVHAPGPSPRYPLVFSRAARRRGRLAGALREGLGAPARARGEVLVKPYWHLAALWRALPQAGLRPVVDPAMLPSLPPRELLALVRRGGFIGHPGAVARRRSRAALRHALERLAQPGDDPFDGLVQRRAAAFFSMRAADTLAHVDTLRRSFAPGRVRTAVVPSDGTPDGRMIFIAGRDSGVELLQVQHGFHASLWDVDGRPAPYIDGLVADRVAMWSERDAEAFAPFARGRVTATGNPGAVALQASARASGDGPALVLLQGTAGGSVAMDARTPFRHVAAALEALAAVRPGGEVVLRPHPLDTADYEAGAPPARGLRVQVERGGPIEPLLAGASLCVGALSTATLQAAVAGVPTVFLNSTGLRLAWPFDGSGDFPYAEDAEGLAARIDEVLAAAGVPGAEAATEALGLRQDAVERLVELVLESARPEGHS
jgi:hypothetical protein